MNAVRVGWADRAKFHDARKHFEAGGEVLVDEFGEALSKPVWAHSTTHTNKTTTWEALAETVRMWRNRYPRQRFYIITRENGT